MGERGATAQEVAAAFGTFAAAEGSRIPMYARLCRAIATDPSLAGLLLAAPVGQRLPVLLLASLHDLVLRRPEVPLGAWYPSVGGRPDHDGDLTAALEATIASYREEVLDRLRHRQVQTNEVNRCVAWRAALATVCAGDDRPLALVEVGASAGLNLGVERYRVEFDGAALDGPVGPDAADVRLATTVRTGAWRELAAPLPPVLTRTGIDRRPLDPGDADDARWLIACTWPEQQVRIDRLRAALSVAVADPPELVRGDLVDDLGALVDRSPDGTHTVVLSSWVLAYVDRDRRSRFAETLAAAARRLAARGGRLTLLTLEADHLLPWLDPPPLPDDVPAEIRHASLLAATAVDRDGSVSATPLARCQAHLVWMDRLGV